MALFAWCAALIFTGSEDSEHATDEERAVGPILQQTVAYAEDQLSQPVTRLLLCGWERNGEPGTVCFARVWHSIRAAQVQARNRLTRKCGITGIIGAIRRMNVTGNTVINATLR
jgi:hypothetical protein